ncbi:MAG: hypothetical protein EOO75_17480 [Myxococcales bacterium]|nr:MAG: hypothetical protein EOO75_17480 [Myxococcales bacterium]
MSIHIPIAISRHPQRRQISFLWLRDGSGVSMADAVVLGERGHRFFTRPGEPSTELVIGCACYPGLAGIWRHLHSRPDAVRDDNLDHLPELPEPGSPGALEAFHALRALMPDSSPPLARAGQATPRVAAAPPTVSGPRAA